MLKVSRAHMAALV